MGGDLQVVASRHRETAVLKLIVDSHLSRRDSELGQMLMTCGKLSNQALCSEKQNQWLTLQLCLVTVGVTKSIECSQLNHLFKTNDRQNVTTGSVLAPFRGKMGKTRQVMIMMKIMMMIVILVMRMMMVMRMVMMMMMVMRMMMVMMIMVMM